MRRRDFIKAIASSSVAWPVAARGQQSRLPVIGYLESWASSDAPQLVAATIQGLKDTGFIEGQNVAIEYRFGQNQNERLPALADDLVHRQVAVIAALGTPAAVAAKAATTTIPIVFGTAGDPVKLGLVASLNRPGGNVTGVSILTLAVTPKRLELLHELIPTAHIMALLVNPANPTLAEENSSSVRSAADALGLELHVLNASAEHEFDEVFAKLSQLRAGGLVIGADPFFYARQEQLGALVARHAVPAIYETREFVKAGGLLGYGGFADSYRLVGVYAGRILKGEKPSELPVQQPTKVELYINLKTAKTLGIGVPLPLLGRADAVIE
jgi:putative tryptophan/tyrosine transport system substrate-binding protein